VATQTIAPAGPAPHESKEAEPAILVEDVEIAYGDFVIQRHLDFAVRRGEIFVIMGGSGCGKTTVMRAMVGLKAPAHGRIVIDGISFWEALPPVRERLARSFGIVYQSGALWSSMTLAENVALPLGEYTDLSRAEIEDVVALKLALVGLAGFEDYYPSEISGGMRKRAGVARALALDPAFLFFDEPSAGLDPVTSSLLDDLIVELRDSLGTTMVMVTHELPSIFAIADNGVYLDAETKTQLATGDPKALLRDPPDPKIRAFLTRGGKEAR
jgi:phospholipid/cholesterol/gamma-HCH transport system ATP-binding protein